MYAQVRWRAIPEGEWGHIRQILTAHVTCYVTVPALQKSAEPAFHCTASLYNDRCCLWLWVFNSHLSRTLLRYIYSVMQ